MNYGELKQELLDIGKLTLADTVGARVAKFVKRAESMIAARVRAVEMVETFPIFESHRAGAGSAVYNLVPTGSGILLDPITVSGGGNPRILTRRGVHELTFSFPTDGPVHSYAIRSELGATAVMQIQFRGTPALDASFACQAFVRRQDMDNDADTRLLLTNHEGLYLNGALHWLYLDAHELELAAGHRQLFLEEVKSVNLAAQEALRAGQIAALDYDASPTGSAM